jgi:hypothetical protein
MNLWAVTMVRDELEVIESVLRHTASEGVAGIIVADNLSTDGTWEWLNDHAATFPCELVLERDTEVGYYQSRKITRLVQSARARGADWVMPFDADEIWFNADQHVTVAATVARDQRGADCLAARLFNYFPTSADDAAVANAFERIRHRDESGAPLRKVIVRARPDVRVLQGNHLAEADGPFRTVGTPIQVGHFPWRSPEQFERKARNGAEAYRATDLPLEMGTHWRQYGDLLDEHGPQVLRDVFDEWFHDPDIDLTERPADFRRFG